MILLPSKKDYFNMRDIQIASHTALFNSYFLGILSFQETITQFKKAINNIEVKAKANALEGFPYAVLACAFETIPI